MNRLLGQKSYVCGPIDRCPDSGAGWRQRLTPELERRGIMVINPLDKPVHAGLEDDDSRDERKLWKEAGNWEAMRAMMKRVRSVDLRFVDVTDFMVVYLDMSVPMCGTWEEVFLANRERKPCLVVCPQGTEAVPDWLFGTIPYEEMFESFDELLWYLDSVADGSIEPEGNRWLFFDIKKLYSPEILRMLTEACS